MRLLGQGEVSEFTGDCVREQGGEVSKITVNSMRLRETIGEVSKVTWDKLRSQRHSGQSDVTGDNVRLG